MSEDQSKQDAISRERVEKLAENLKATAENVLDLIAAEEIQVEPLLEATRFMARTARRIGRRANWPVGEPPPGNRKDGDERPKRKAPAGRGGGERRGSGAPRGDGSRGSGRSGGPARRGGGARRS